jgi:hypothetical protein
MIPQALSRALRTPPLVPEQFVPTKWNSAEDKAAFGNRLLTLIAKDFQRTTFSRSFYERLSNTFGHIAHYAEDAVMRSGGVTTSRRLLI